MSKALYVLNSPDIEDYLKIGNFIGTQSELLESIPVDFSPFRYQYEISLFLIGDEYYDALPEIYKLLNTKYSIVEDRGWVECNLINIEDAIFNIISAKKISNEITSNCTSYVNFFDDVFNQTRYTVPLSIIHRNNYGVGSYIKIDDLYSLYIKWCKSTATPISNKISEFLAEVYTQKGNLKYAPIQDIRGEKITCCTIINKDKVMIIDTSSTTPIIQKLSFYV